MNRKIDALSNRSGTIYPAPLTRGSRLAVTAFSGGIRDVHQPRFRQIVRSFADRGIEIVVGECLIGGMKHVSAPYEVRAAELQAFLLDDSIDAIAPPWGGELAIELLPLLDFSLIAQAKPKWIFGFSDVSTITAALHYRCGWATAHCANLMDLIDTAEDRLTAKTLDYLQTSLGEVFTQSASAKFTRNWPDIKHDPLAAIEGNQETQWRWLVQPQGEEVMRGRLIGGCWDTICHLFETPYLNLSYLRTRSDDGLLLFLENVEMSPCDLVRVLHSMDFRGVFDVIDGLILGRNSRLDSDNDHDLRYLEVLERHLKNKGIPVLYDADIGHVPPNLTLINGALATVGRGDGGWFVKQKFV